MKWQTISLVISLILFAFLAFGTSGKWEVGFLGAGLLFFAASFIAISAQKTP